MRLTAAALLMAMPGLLAPAAEDVGVPEAVEAEARLLALLNEERGTRGIAPLGTDRILTRLARRHSRTMRSFARLDHENPLTGTRFADRARAAGVPASAFGENVARARSAAEAHRALMDSPGHRANILDEQYTHVGIGITREAGGALFITQDFARLPDRDPGRAERRLLAALQEARRQGGLPPLVVRRDLGPVMVRLADTIRRTGRTDVEVPAALPRPVHTLSLVLPDPEAIETGERVSAELAAVARRGSGAAVGVVAGPSAERPEGALFAAVAVFRAAVPDAVGAGESGP